VGRVEYIRQLGLDYKSMEREEGCGIAVADVSARFKAPAQYDDELVIQTRLLAVRGPVIRFGYRIVRATDHRLLCEGETVHIVVGKDMKRMPLPKKYADRFAEHLIR
jgi:acyl-CoA thioester hydrolase